MAGKTIGMYALNWDILCGIIKKEIEAKEELKRIE